MIFESPFDKEDIRLLDIKSATTLIPTLVNIASKLRERAKKANIKKVDNLEEKA